MWISLALFVVAFIKHKRTFADKKRMLNCYTGKCLSKTHWISVLTWFFSPSLMLLLLHFCYIYLLLFSVSIRVFIGSKNTKRTSTKQRKSLLTILFEQMFSFTFTLTTFSDAVSRSLHVKNKKPNKSVQMLQLNCIPFIFYRNDF